MISLWTSSAQATALLVCPGPDGVVISADSRGASLKGEVEAYDKLHVVGERVVVAAAGLLTIRDSHGTVFDVHDLIRDATHRLAARASATEVAHALAAAMRKKLPAIVGHPSVTRAPHPQLVLLVVGQKGSAWTIVRVLGELRPLAVSEKPLDDALVGIGLGPHHLDPEGVVFEFLRKRRLPVAAATLDERVALCGAILQVESELNPTVGPPILQAILRPIGAVERTTYAAPSPCPQPRRLTPGGRAPYLVGVNVRKPHSPRFVRVSEADARALFGGEALEPRYTISNGRWVARQRVAVVGKSGRIDGVPVVGPAVEHTTISWSVGDHERLGVDARGVLIVGTHGEIKLVEEARAAQ